MNNFIVIILDSVGIGELPDAAMYGDKGSDTLGNLAKKVGGLNLPNLQKFGLGNINTILGVEPAEYPLASFGKLAEQSLGKDSTTGHWEIGGVITRKEFPVYPNGFPKELIDKFLVETGLNGILGNCTASGTEIIERLGEEHCKTGFPIVYTSADSVFQIAAHEEIIPIERQYEICKIAREKVLINVHEVGRIIARPFITQNGIFTRTTNRKDFSIDPSSPTILNYLSENGIETYGVGKINDLFNYSGIKHQIKSKSNNEGIDKIIDANKKANNSFIMVNLVDFDVYYGHRNDPEGYYKTLQEFDVRLPEIVDAMDDSDQLILTADHGNDTTDISTDHTREYVPLLYFRKSTIGKNLGTRSTFADVAQTAAHFFEVSNGLEGKSFLNE
ncbi:MAG: phosphopentomutase [Ignavibacteria bacterium]|nr:MAG: phosphopentomutase [Ignavibacteria bacterium]KAF0157267.1 MAG: phosphopentomutase [Ignavibacteria bacterium]